MTPHRAPHEPLRVVVAGGGVAAMEAVVALDALARGRVRTTVVSASPDLVYRPMVIGEPFGMGAPRRYPLEELCGPLGAAVVPDGVCAVEPERHVVLTGARRELPYDVLLVAVGARRVPVACRYDTVLAQISEGVTRHVAIVVPEGLTWTLPAYELALLTAGMARRPGGGRPAVTVVTAEGRPLEVFGRRAADEVARLLAYEGVGVRQGAEPPVDADRVVRIPLPEGPRLPGLPADAGGFIRVDAEARVPGVEDVFAAGDGTTTPVRQGGLAAQQAELAAAAIARRAGAEVAPVPVRPVLRGLLRTPSGPRYLRAELADPDGTSTISAEPLWWPPSKIASRWLAPHLTRMDAGRRYGQAVA